MARLQTYQTEDGVRVPEVLQQYMPARSIFPVCASRAAVGGREGSGGQEPEGGREESARARRGQGARAGGRRARARGRGRIERPGVAAIEARPPPRLLPPAR